MTWLFSLRSPQSPPPSPPLDSTFSSENLLSVPSQISHVVGRLSPLQQASLSACLACGATIGAFYSYRFGWKRIKTADFVTPEMLNGKKWIRGRVTSVGDADNFRIYHTPGPFWSYPFKLRQIPKDSKGITSSLSHYPSFTLRGETIHIRIAGVDAPEAAHFGRPAQPLSAEALAFLKSEIEGQDVDCLLFSRDQYGRIVALPLIPRSNFPFLPWKVLPLRMLRAGWGAVYTAGGAQYGYIGLESFQAAEAYAKRRKLGIWSLGNKLEKPDAYKRRIALLEAASNSTSTTSLSSPESRGGMFELKVFSKGGWRRTLWRGLRKTFGSL
ncbi:mitochondrion protein [Phaffia rhodozyma]|uniref:Mitochondrion protein n=1 Tax=Phaffia rhodozyma TaxID=264483 RepID=A0A0F7SXM8_PHARH|nr:mitochondrion protein [Phaffia rhodozyma]